MSDADDLRRLVREVLREVLPAQGSRAVPAADGPPPAPHGGASDRAPDGAPDVRRVRVADDRDLADLVTQVLNLAEDPACVADLRSGRTRFSLVTSGSAAAPEGPAPLDVERGAVTERIVQRAAREQRPLRVGPRAVVTPLARDRARSLGVTIHRASSLPGGREETR